MPVGRTKSTSSETLHIKNDDEQSFEIEKQSRIAGETVCGGEMMTVGKYGGIIFVDRFDDFDEFDAQGHSEGRREREFQLKQMFY